MKDETIIQLLSYLDGTLPEGEQQALTEQLAHDPNLHDTLEQLKALYASIKHLPTEMPSESSEIRFQEFLTIQKEAIRAQNPKNKIISMFPALKMEWGLAAASLVLLIGLGLGLLWKNNQNQQNEIQALRQEMRQTQRMLILAMLDKPSASERIRAVNVLQKEQADPKIIEALIQTMNFDDMINVRMKAVQALAHFGSDSTAKQALMEGLSNQKSPEVQIAIIEVLVTIGEKRAVPAFKRMQDDKELMEIVRKKAASGIRTLI